MANVALCLVLDERNGERAKLAQAAAKWTADPNLRSVQVLGYRKKEEPTPRNEDENGNETDSSERGDTHARIQEVEQGCRNKRLDAGDICSAVRRAVQKLQRMPGDAKTIVLTCTGPVDKDVLERPDVLKAHGKLVALNKATLRILVIGENVSDKEQAQWCEVANRLAGRKRNPNDPKRAHVVPWDKLHTCKLEFVGASVKKKKNVEEKGNAPAVAELKPVRGASSIGILPTCANERRLMETCAKVKKTTAVGVEVPEEKRVEVVPIAKLHRLAKMFTTPLVEVAVGRLETAWRHQGPQKRSMLVPNQSRGALTLCYAPNGGIQLLCTMKNPKGFAIEEIVYVPEGRSVEEEDAEVDFLEGDDTARSFRLTFHVRGNVVGPDTGGKGACCFYFWLLGKDVGEGRDAVHRMLRILCCPPSLSVDSHFRPSVLRAIRRGLQEAEAHELKRVMTQRARQVVPRPSTVCGSGRGCGSSPSTSRAVPAAAPLRKGFLCVRRTRPSSASVGMASTCVRASTVPRDVVDPVSDASSVPSCASLDRTRWRRSQQQVMDPAKAEVRRALSRLQDPPSLSDGTDAKDGSVPPGRMDDVDRSTRSSPPSVPWEDGPAPSSSTPSNSDGSPPVSWEGKGWTQEDEGGGDGSVPTEGVLVTTTTLSDWLDTYDPHPRR